MPVLALVLLIIVATSLPSTWAAANGRGTPGTYTAAHQECSYRGCVWYGTYASEDGQVQLPDAVFGANPEGWSPGSTASVIYAGGTDPAAVYIAGSKLPVSVVIGLGALSLVALAAWATALVRTTLRRPFPGWIRRLLDLIRQSD